MNTNGSFGNWLRQRRKALDLTQADLADQVGCSITTIRKIESDRRRPSRQISERMADVLAIAPEDHDSFVNFARRVVNEKAAPSPDWAALMPISNLPAPLTPFIGREPELAHIADRLSDPDCRLLTLVGPGGIGKTRLALQAAAGRVGAYADGVYFVSLTPVGAITMVSAAIASALQVSFYGQQDRDAQIINYLRGKHMLLVLDNYEHLLGSIGLLEDILISAPRLKLLVTSRERLNLQQEWALPIAGLPYPTHDDSSTSDHCEAVELFVKTAQRMEPGFTLEGSQAAVVDICRAVEGMPLGLELAATWLRAIPCDQIAGQIQRDLDFLATPLHNVENRHRSLRAVFEHSWGLLSKAEQDAVMKLSVFRGGCDLEAAETVAGAPLRLLAGLMDKSLVRLNPAGRYEMHELLRQFAADKLLESGQIEQTRNCHLQYYLNLAENIEGQFYGPQHLAALNRLEIEHDNCRTALDWAEQSGAADAGLGLAAALGFFWDMRGYWTEGQNWLQQFLITASSTDLSFHAKALVSLFGITNHFHDSAYYQSLREKALNLLPHVQDPGIRARLLMCLGRNEPPNPGEAYMKDALALFQQLGDQRGICETLSALARQAFQFGDFASAGRLQDEAIRLARQSGDKHNLAILLMLSACKNWYSGKMDRHIEKQYIESLALFFELRYKAGTMIILTQLGKFALRRGEHERARVFFGKALLLAQQTNDKGLMPVCLIGLAEVFSRCGEAERSARILGALHTDVQTHWTEISISEQEVRQDYERSLSAARAGIDEATFTATFAAGQRMTIDWIITDALSNTVKETSCDSLEEVRAATEASDSGTLADPLLTDSLTPREMEILHYMSAGLTNREIADHLVIGVTTVKKHVSHIYSKLGVTDRVKAINRARALGLLPHPVL